MARPVKLTERSMDAAFSLEVHPDEGASIVRSEEPPFDASVAVREGRSGVWSVVTAQGSYEASVRLENGEVHVEVDGEPFLFEDTEDAGDGVARRASARADVKAPMPGKVVKLLVAEGETVSSGQGILLFEAMKMQNEIRSPQDGVLTELSVEEGQPVDAREPLFVVRQIDN